MKFDLGLEELKQDIRIGSRGLLRTPGFTAVAVLTLGLGIGATTVFFSLADHILLRPMSHPQVERLVVVREIIKEFRDRFPTLPANAGHYLEWRRRCGGCQDLAALRPVELTMTWGPQVELVGAGRVSANLLPMLGASPAIGRLLSEDDDREGARVVVLGDGIWRRLGADPAIVGNTLTLDGTAWTVVGVVGRGFRFPRRHELGLLGRGEIDVFVPLALTADERSTPGDFSYGVLGRMVPGVTVAQLAGQLEVVAADLTEQAGGRVSFGAVVTPLQRQVVGSAGTGLVLLLGAGAVVLVLVAVNLGHLLLARNLARAREWAVRTALGARRGRLVRQTLTESLLIAVAGGAVGLMLASWGVAVLVRLAPADLPRLDEVRLDGRILLISFAVCLIVGLAFGTLPASRSSRADPADALRGGRGSERTGDHSRRQLLIGFQAALSAVLLAAAGLLTNSFVRVTQVEKGFTVGPVVAVDLLLPGDSYPSAGRRTALFDDLLGRLAATPGVEGAAVANGIPLEGEVQGDLLSVENDTRPEGARPLANIRAVSPGYFAVIGTPLVRGRLFTEADRTRPVVVLSERAAAALWPGVDPIGRQVVPGSNTALSVVIGVVADIKSTSLETLGSPAAYLPYWSFVPVQITLLVKASGEAQSLVEPVRSVVRAVAPAVPITRVRTLPGVWRTATAERLFQLVVVLAFAITAVVVAAVGMFGLVAHSLERRTTEIGVRLALGAPPARVRRQIVVGALVPVSVGLVVGLGISIGLGQVAANLLFGVQASDPVTLFVVSGAILVVAATACWLPALRATRGAVLRILRAG